MYISKMADAALEADDAPASYKFITDLLMRKPDIFYLVDPVVLDVEYLSENDLDPFIERLVGRKWKIKATEIT